MKSIVPIVTINFNGHNDTLALVKSLNDSNESYYLVIVDNKSPKEGEFNSLKKDIESFYKKSFIDEKIDPSLCEKGYFLDIDENKKISLLLSLDNGGFSKGTNIGLKHALKRYPDCKYISILNNDTEVEKDFISKIIEVLDEDENKAAGMGTIYYYGQKEPYIWSIGGYPVWKKGQCEHVHKDEIMNESIKGNQKYVERGFVSGCFTVFKTEKLKEISLLDEDYFFAGEEYQYSVDLCKKYKLVWVPESVIYHKSILNVGNGSSHKINSIEWQYSAYRTKCVFINKNKNFIFRCAWKLMIKHHLAHKTKQRLISTGVCNDKQFKYFFKSIKKHINDKKYLASEFQDFKENALNLD